MHNGQVTVHAESCEKKDAGVEVENDQPCTGLTQEPPKRPVILHGSGRRPHWESDDESEVGHGEVKNENVGHRFELHVAVDDGHHQAVSDDAEDKVAAVHDGHQGEDDVVISRHTACQIDPFCCFHS